MRPGCRALVRIGNALVSAVAGLLCLSLAGLGGWALADDAVVQRSAFADAELLQYKPAQQDPSLAELRELNEDVCGWLTLPQTHIDYPVVQGTNNMEYVNRDVYGEFSLSGAIFLDSRCDRDFSGHYNILYGHHLDNGAMFGDVAEFTDAEYFDAHPGGSLVLEDAVYEIELFACLRTDAYDAAVYTPENCEEDLAPLLRYIREEAVQYRAIDVTPDDKLIALSTCEQAETDGRVVLFGRLTPKEGENT